MRRIFKTTAVRALSGAVCSKPALTATSTTTTFSFRWCSTFDPMKIHELQTNGSQLFSEGDFEAAITEWDTARKILEEHHQNTGTASPITNDLVVVLNNLACAHGEAGRVAKKKDLLNDTLDLVSKSYGKDHPQYAITLYNLASSHGDLGNFETMKSMLEEAAAAYAAKFGPNHAKVARVLLLLADALEGLKLFEEQKAIMEKAAAIVERHCGANHPQTAVALAALGKAYGNTGDKLKKLRLLERAYAIEEKKYGTGHPQLCMGLNNLALAHGDVGEYETKKNLLEESIAVQKKTQAANATGTSGLLATTYANYASVFGELGDLKQQLEWHKFALRFTMDKLGSAHPQVMVCLNNCASTYLAMGDAVGAEKVALSTIEMLDDNKAPEGHPERHRAQLILSQSREEVNKKGEEEKK